MSSTDLNRERLATVQRHWPGQIDIDSIHARLEDGRNQAAAVHDASFARARAQCVIEMDSRQCELPFHNLDSVSLCSSRAGPNKAAPALRADEERLELLRR